MTSWLRNKKSMFEASSDSNHAMLIQGSTLIVTRTDTWTVFWGQSNQAMTQKSDLTIRSNEPSSFLILSKSFHVWLVILDPHSPHIYQRHSLQIINRHKVKGIVGRSRFQGGLDCFGDSNWMEESEGWKTVISNHFYHSPDLALEVLLLVVKNCDLLNYHLLSFRIMQTYGFGKPTNCGTNLSNISKAQNERMFFKVCQCGAFQCFWDFCTTQGQEPQSLEKQCVQRTSTWKSARSIWNYIKR